MGLLVDGKWHDKWYDTKSSGGKFERSASKFRNWVTADGAAGPSGESGFKAEPGRYHLYVSLACPWAHRTLIFRKLKKLDGIISVSVVHPHMAENGWTFEKDAAATGDDLYGLAYLPQIYTNLLLQRTRTIRPRPRRAYIGPPTPTATYIVTETRRRETATTGDRVMRART